MLFSTFQSFFVIRKCSVSKSICTKGPFLLCDTLSPCLCIMIYES